MDLHEISLSVVPGTDTAGIAVGRWLRVITCGLHRSSDIRWLNRARGNLKPTGREAMNP